MTPDPPTLTAPSGTAPQLLYLDSADANKDVTLYINSPGGSVTAGGCRALAVRPVVVVLGP